MSFGDLIAMTLDGAADGTRVSDAYDLDDDTRRIVQATAIGRRFGGALGKRLARLEEPPVPVQPPTYVEANPMASLAGTPQPPPVAVAYRARLPQPPHPPQLDDIL